MTNALPLGARAGLESIKSNQEQISNVHERAGLYAAKVLQIVGDAPIAGGFLQEIRDRGYAAQEDQGYKQIRVRVESLHSYLDERNDVKLHPIAIVGNATPVTVGSVVQVSFRDNFSSEGGFVVSAAGGVAGKGDTNNDGSAASAQRKAGKFPAGGGQDLKVAPIEFNTDIPFTIRVDGRLNNTRLVIREALATIATVAGWYYGAKDSSTVYVTSGFRQAKPGGKPPDKGNHSSGNASDYKLIIDGVTLTRGEAWAFVQALRICLQKDTKNRDNFGGPDENLVYIGGLGLYSGNDAANKKFFRPEKRSTPANPHYDVRILGANAWHWFDPPKNSKGGASTTLDPYKESFKEKNNLKVADNVLKRVRAIVRGISKQNFSYRKNKVSWARLLEMMSKDEAIKAWKEGGKGNALRYGIDTAAGKTIFTPLKLKPKPKKGASIKSPEQAILDATAESEAPEITGESAKEDQFD